MPSEGGQVSAASDRGAGMRGLPLSRDRPRENQACPHARSRRRKSRPVLLLRDRAAHVRGLPHPRRADPRHRLHGRGRRVGPVAVRKPSDRVDPRLLGRGVVRDATLWFRCLHKADRERALVDESRSAETGEPLNSEYRMIARDGRVIWFHDQATIVSRGRRRPFFHGVMLDITDRKEAEAKVRRQRGPTRRSARGWHRWESGSGTWTPTNDALGRAPPHLRDRRAASSAASSRQASTSSIPTTGRSSSACSPTSPSTRSPSSYQVRIVRPDGRMRICDNHGDVVVDDHGKPVRIVGIVQDITERKHTEGALRQSHEQFQSIIDNSPSVIYAKDSSFRYLFANREFGLMFQVEPETMIGKTDETIMPLDVAGRARASDRKVLEEGEIVQEEEVICAPRAATGRTSPRSSLCATATGPSTRSAGSPPTSPSARRASRSSGPRSTGRSACARPSASRSSCCTHSRSSTSPRTRSTRRSCWCGCAASEATTIW